jgi:hypothetical protein
MTRLHRFGPPPENGVPPQEVRFVDLRVEPWPDGRRVRVFAEVNSFLENPDLEASITTPDGEEIAHASIIETAEEKIVFTMHLRALQVGGVYNLTARVLYSDLGVVDEKTISFETYPSPTQEG